MKRHLAAFITLFIAWATFLLLMGSDDTAGGKLSCLSAGGVLSFVYFVFARGLMSYRVNEFSFWLVAALTSFLFCAGFIAEDFVLHHSFLSARTGGRILFGIAVIDVALGFYFRPKKSAEASPSTAAGGPGP